MMIDLDAKSPRLRLALGRARRPRAVAPRVRWARIAAIALLLPLATSAQEIEGGDSTATPSDEPIATAHLGEYDPLYDEDAEEIEGFPDPFETMNRGTFRVNREIDRFVLSPIAAGYRFLVPTSIRKSVRNVLANFNSIPILVNDGLQLEWKDGGITLARFVINSTIGLAGIFDPAARWGMEGHRSDFGQTLSLAGVESGPYLIIPVLGPTTLRDGTGQVVDTLLRPTVYFFGPVELLFYEGTTGIARRDENDEALTALRESSLDFYVAMRSAFYQNRSSEIWKRRDDRRD